MTIITVRTYFYVLKTDQSHQWHIQMLYRGTPPRKKRDGDIKMFQNENKFPWGHTTASDKELTDN